jgi:endonuclease YncB( thermonuclease family)
LAWHFKRYSDNPLLAIAEKEARAARKGLWKEDNPTPPWEYRSKSRFSHK